MPSNNIYSLASDSENLAIRYCVHHTLSIYLHSVICVQCMLRLSTSFSTREFHWMVFHVFFMCRFRTGSRRCPLTFCTFFIQQVERLTWTTMAVPTTWTTAQEPLPIVEGAGRTEVVPLLLGCPLPAQTPGIYRPGEKCSTEGLCKCTI